MVPNNNPAYTEGVPFGDQKREVSNYLEDINDAFTRVIQSGRFILGSELAAFESEFADWLGSKFAIGVASGTEAITLALKALGVGPGDEVITSANTCVPTAVGIISSGATIRLADCDPDTLMIDLESVEKALSHRTRAIVPVHLYGNGANMVELKSLAERHGLLVVEDCAQATGTKISNRNAGLYSDAAAFSFYPTKNLGAYGDGGCVITQDKNISDRLYSLRNYGYSKRDYSLEIGLNSRLDELQAAILRTKLPHIEDWNRRRLEIAGFYRAGLAKSGIRIPSTAPYVENVYHLFPILVDNRDIVQSKLTNIGIQSLIHYPTPLHLQPALSDLGYKVGDFPNAEDVCNKILSLPMFPQLHDYEASLVVEGLTS